MTILADRVCAHLRDHMLPSRCSFRINGTWGAGSGFHLGRDQRRCSCEAVELRRSMLRWLGRRVLLPVFRRRSRRWV